MQILVMTPYQMNRMFRFARGALPGKEVAVQAILQSPTQPNPQLPPGCSMGTTVSPSFELLTIRQSVRTVGIIQTSCNCSRIDKVNIMVTIGVVVRMGKQNAFALSIFGVFIDYESGAWKKVLKSTSAL